MERINNILVILKLIESLKRHGSWCGETHVQKAIFSLQELKGIPLEFQFVLYKHGPFSFDLRDELTAMRADGLISFKIVNESYGPQLVISDRGEEIKRKFSRILNKYDNSIEFIGKNLGDKGVVELERIATALYVTREMRITDKDSRIEKIVALKPHIQSIQAKNAVEEIDALIREANT